jgi:hypothetical protein
MPSNRTNQQLAADAGVVCLTGKFSPDTGVCSVAGGLCREREKHTICELEAQIGIPG